MTQAGRNERCPCGSGRKYKRCCLPSEHAFVEGLELCLNGVDGVSLLAIRQLDARRLAREFNLAPKVLTDELDFLLRAEVQVKRAYHGPTAHGIRLLLSANEWIEISAPEQPLRFSPQTDDDGAETWIGLLWAAQGGDLGEEGARVHERLASFVTKLKAATGPEWPWRIAPDALGADSPLPPAPKWEWIALSGLALSSAPNARLPAWDRKASAGTASGRGTAARVAQRAGLQAGDLPEALVGGTASWNRGIWDQVWLKEQGQPPRLLLDILTHFSTAGWARERFPLVPSLDEVPAWAGFDLRGQGADVGSSRALIAWLVRSLRSTAVPAVYLCTGRQLTRGMPAFLVDRIDFDPSSSVQIQLRAAVPAGSKADLGELDVEIMNEDGLPLQPWAYSQLPMWRYEGRARRLIFTAAGALSRALWQASVRGAHGTAGSPERVGRFLRELGKGFVEQGLPPPGGLIARHPRARPEVWVEEDGRYCFGLAIPELNLRFWNYPAAADELLGALKGGIGAVIDSEALAPRSRNEKRRRALKLLRHQGIAMGLVGGKLGSTPGDQDPRLAALLGSPDESLRACVGDASARYAIRQFPERIEQALGESLTVASGHGPMILDSALPAAFAVIQNRIEALLDERGPELLARERFEGVGDACGASIRADGAGEKAPPWSAMRYRGGEPRLESWLPLMDQGVRLYWRGTAVESLDDAEFRIALEIRKKAGDATGGGELDWFELHPEVFLRGERVPSEDVRAAAGSGLLRFRGQLYRIPRQSVPSLRRLERFWDSLTRPKGAKAERASDQAGRFEPLPRSEALDLLTLRRKGIEIHGDPAWERLRRAFDQLDEPRPAERPISGFACQLKDYQKSGVEWLADLDGLGLGGVLADDMGLGKTVQVLGHLQRLREKTPGWRGLVVVPSSLVYNWKSEAARFVPDLPVSQFQVGDPAALERPGLLLASYGMMVEHAERLEKEAWDVIVFDEAQNLKTLAAQRTRVARRLRARIKLALTGTPIENHLGELFSIVDLVVPGALGDWDRYQRTYLGEAGGSSESIAWLRAKIRPLMLRREKRQVLDQLPPKIEQERFIDFDSRQRRLYRDTALAWNQRVRDTVQELGESQSQLAMLTALLRLRQICSDPAALPDSKYEGMSPKLEAVCAVAAEAASRGESCIVFTQFISTLETLRAALAGQDVRVDVIHGAVSRGERERLIRQFQEGTDARVLIMTLKTGGVGLNLTRAAHVLHVDPWWNPAAEDQATDRAHRIGQTQVVQVTRFLMRESVEERIRGLQAGKRAQFEALMGAETLDGDGPCVGLRRSAGYRLTRSEFDSLISAEA